MMIYQQINKKMMKMLSNNSINFLDKKILLFDQIQLQNSMPQSITYDDQRILLTLQIKEKEMAWKSVVYDPNNTQIPSERWGHRLVSTKSNQLVLFGGFGGSSSEGLYLSDMWTFSTETCTWKILKCSGQIPQARSNYTVHYNSVDDQLILYGGGSNGKTKYNSVCVLDWKTKVWTKYLPQESAEAPWERTYHSSQFCYPYLIIHGGEGVSNLDLDDMWVFNVVDKKWRQLSFDLSEPVPRKRRFHSTSLLGDYFYVIGGCTENYLLLGDAYRVNLKSLFESKCFCNFRWECVVAKNKILERWGHSSDIYQGKIVISYGRISSTADANDTIILDIENNLLIKLNVGGKLPIPRRRHASIIVGCSLLVFGGYDGKYLNDFHYLNLNAFQKPIRNSFQTIIVDSLQKLQDVLTKSEQTSQNDFKIKLQSVFKPVCIIKANKNELMKNQFMKNLLKYSNDGSFSIHLPQFCDVIVFRLMLLTILKNKIIVLKTFDCDYYKKFMLTNEYFVCQQANNAIQHHLEDIIDQTNCQHILGLSTFCQLGKIKKKAAEVYLINHQGTDLNNINFKKDILNSQIMKCSPEDTGQVFQFKQFNHPDLSILHQVYQNIKFDFHQSRLRKKRFNIFERAAKHMKNIFSISAESQTQENDVSKLSKNQHGCISRIIHFVSAICTGTRIHAEEAQQ